MKLQIIKPKFGYMAVSEEPILQGKHWWIHPETEHLGFAEEDLKAPYLRVVATHTSFKFEGIPQFEFEKIDDAFDSWNKEPMDFRDISEYRDYEAGYKAAQEKGCYSEKDLVRAIKMSYGQAKQSTISVRTVQELILKSLNQPKKLVAIEVDDMKASAWVSNEKGHGRVNINLPIGTKSEEYPDGLLTIQKYYYE